MDLLIVVAIAAALVVGALLGLLLRRPARDNGELPVPSTPAQSPATRPPQKCNATDA
jgi:hypothetical protein